MNSRSLALDMLDWVEEQTNTLAIVASNSMREWEAHMYLPLACGWLF